MARIYISSTSIDLEDYRKIVGEGLRRLGHEDVAMEYYVAEDKRPLDRSLSSRFIVARPAPSAPIWIANRPHQCKFAAPAGSTDGCELLRLLPACMIRDGSLVSRF